MEEEKIKQPDKLYVTFEIPKTIREFLILFYFDKKTFREEFVYRSSVSHRTYSDKECKVLQCYESKIRSFDDLMILVNTYYPDTDAKTLMLEILNLDYREEKNKLLYPMFYYCSDVHKSTLRWVDFVSDTLLGQRDYVQDSEYYWNNLLLLAGININEKNDLKNYLTKKQLQNA
jgi:hypothetical protein